MTPLPDHATEASRRRAELAERLAQSCPADLADEITLVGSTARGYADDDSDLELNLWAATIPPLDSRIAWLQAAGASDIHVEKQPRPDNSYWIHASISSIPIEVGWQTFESLTEQLDLILSAKSTDRQALAFADMLVGSLTLRTTGRLTEWKSALRLYSDAMQSRLILGVIVNWSYLGEWSARRKMARHGERLALTLSLLNELNSAMRLLYAVNRRWQPSAKWTLTVAREFAPFDLDARIDAILSDPSLERRVDLCAQLCLDVLALVPEQYDVSAAVQALQARAE